MASDETIHLYILIPPQKAPKNHQYLSGCVHWAGIDEVLSRRDGSQSSENTMVGTGGQWRREGLGKGPGCCATEPGGGSTHLSSIKYHPVEQVHAKQEEMQAQRDYVMCQRSHKPVNGKARFEFRSPSSNDKLFLLSRLLSLENVIIRVKKKFFQNRKPESALTE